MPEHGNEEVPERGRMNTSVWRWAGAAAHLRADHREDDPPHDVCCSGVPPTRSSPSPGGAEEELHAEKAATAGKTFSSTLTVCVRGREHEDQVMGASR